MIAIARGLRRIADHIDPAGAARVVAYDAAVAAERALFARPVRHILTLKRLAAADARAAAKSLSLPNFTGK